MSPHIYDLIEVISEKMVSNINQTVRTTCSQIFISFLLEYPLEEKRVEQHIYFLIKNLSYFREEGRYQILEIISLLIPQFPTEILDNFAFLLFLSLILRTVNEKNRK
jgi:U3 small nucleolar RNA-associated protein 20